MASFALLFTFFWLIAYLLTGCTSPQVPTEPFRGTIYTSEDIQTYIQEKRLTEVQNIIQDAYKQEKPIIRIIIRDGE